MDILEELPPTERISRLLDTVEEGTLRHRALEGALEFKGSWVELARHLKDVEDEEKWKEWDYKSFNAYCKDELQLSRGEVRKLRQGYQWLEDEAPELIVEVSDNSVGSDISKPRPIPDMDTVDQLAKGYREVEKERVPRDTYQELKRAALDGERSSYQLRREFKEAIPEHKRERKPANPRKHLKRALKALEKALSDIEEQGEDADPKLFERARELRDEIFHLVATKEEESDE